MQVCLSILGTWAGPSWSPALSLSSLLISIQVSLSLSAFNCTNNLSFSFLQSLMTDKPYHNEPGYETERFGGDVKRRVLVALTLPQDKSIQAVAPLGC